MPPPETECRGAHCAGWATTGEINMPNGAARPAPVRQDAEAGGADMHASRHDAAR